MIAKCDQHNSFRDCASMEKIRSQSWVGNIYHKFEAVCQEVDEFVTKDSVKYVENQVQSVGANMKKLYSGVMQDFLIPADDHVKREAQAVNGKPEHAVGTYTSSVTNTTQNPVNEQSCLNPYADSSLESHNASASTELDGVVASEEAEIVLSVGNECTTAICKNSCKVFKKNKIMEEALVDEESSTSKDGILSVSYSDKDSNDTMCYSFQDDDKFFSDVSSSHTILQDDVVREKQPPAKGSSSFLDNLSKSPLRASMNEKLFDSPPDAINCISNVPSSQMVLQRNIAREVQPVADQSNSLGDMAKSMEKSNGNSTGLSSSSFTSLASANNAVSIIPALSSSPSLTDFSVVNASSSHESVAGSIKNDLEWCPSPNLKVLMRPAEIGCMNDSAVDYPGLETVDLTDKGKLKESCVPVDSKLQNRVSFRPRKYKSYKELIQEAFASRKRLIKEYKQLAVLYADVDAETSQHVELSRLPSLPLTCVHSTELSTCNICEPGWEFL